MQIKKQKKSKNIAKTSITGVVAMILFTITIPALSLIKIPVEEESTGFSIKFDMSPIGDVENTIEVNAEQKAPDGISQEDYDKNNFYLVQNYKTGEVVKLTPTEYIKGVVSAEMPITFHEEALKAQAITAHSYALRQIETAIKNVNPELNGAYLSNNPANFQACYFEDERRELWGDKFDEYEEKLNTIISEVITKIAVVDNEPIIGAFHSLSNGQTETAEQVWGQPVSYLVSTHSTGDQFSPNYEMATTLLSNEVEHALKTEFPNITLDENINNWFSEIELNESGRISSIKVGDELLTGHELRTILKLRSASFEIEISDDKFIFNQVGYGHGVGLSQYGADYMARQGYNYEEILKHYFNGIEIVLLN